MKMSNSVQMSIQTNNGSALFAYGLVRYMDYSTSVQQIRLSNHIDPITLFSF